MRVRVTFFFLSFCLLGQNVFAQGAAEEVESSQEVEETTPSDRDNLLEDAEEVEMQYQITLPRVWALTVPSSGLDLFLSRHSNTGDDSRINYVFGTEFIFRQVGRGDTVIGIDYADLRTPDDFWLEDGDPVRDADWTTNSLHLLTLDLAYHWTKDLTATGDLQLYYGMGLGLSVVFGDVYKYNVDSSCLAGQGDSEDTSLLDQCFDEEGDPRIAENTKSREDKVWPVVPALSFTLGSRYFITDNIVAGFEFGFKSIYTYGGLEFGYVF